MRQIGDCVCCPSDNACTRHGTSYVVSVALENAHQSRQGSSVSNAVLVLWFDSKQTKNEAGLLFNIFATAATLRHLSTRTCIIAADDTGITTFDPCCQGQVLGRMTAMEQCG